ncbi:MAG: hypothetical protein HKP54_16085 [Boseongicola sp.]|nr:hypothetical protein [Boseongicola sp.]
MIEDVSNGALLCGAAAMVSLSLLWRIRGPWDRIDQSPGLRGLGVITVLGWASASLVLQDIQMLFWMISLALGLVLKFRDEMDVSCPENQALLGGLAIFPLVVQALI